MMYTRGFTRGPSKLVTQRRTGPTQQIENKTNDLKLTSWLSSNSSAPKIVFNRPNGKGYHTVAIQKEEPPSEGFTPAHEENVRFVYEGELSMNGGIFLLLVVLQHNARSRAVLRWHNQPKGSFQLSRRLAIVSLRERVL
uniref:Uncharacterized protein n=1 Tax=Esox lucius TaxID=8010 RepID=A0AAY5KQ73_ESOLU